MAGERDSRVEAIRKSRLRDLAAFIRRSGKPPTLEEVSTRPFASEVSRELFTLTAQRADLLGRTLAGLGSTVDESSPRAKKDALSDLRTQVIGEVKADPLFGLARDFLRVEKIDVPPFLEEVEASDQKPLNLRARKRFVLGERPYGGTEGPILRLLYLTSKAHPLEFDAITAIFHPQIFATVSDKYEWVVRNVLEDRLPSSLERFNPTFKVKDDGLVDGKGKIGYYLLDTTPPVSQAATKFPVDAKERELQQTIVVKVHTNRDYIAIYDEQIPLKRSLSPVQVKSDALILLDFIAHQPDPDTWIKSSDMDKYLAEHVTSGIDTFRQRTHDAQEWLLSLLNYRGRTVLQSFVGTHGKSLKLGNYALDIQETDEPIDPRKARKRGSR